MDAGGAHGEWLGFRAQLAIHASHVVLECEGGAAFIKVDPRYLLAHSPHLDLVSEPRGKQS